MQSPGKEAHIRALDREEIDAILARNHVGRIGFARGGRMDIQPVHYVFSDGWIYGRTSYGSKYVALGETAYGWWPVVFQVDEVEDLFRWRSVLAQGGFYILSGERGEADLDIWEQAPALLRTLVPETLAENDPVPFRTVLFRIAVQEASGRESTPPAIE